MIINIQRQIESEYRYMYMQGAVNSLSILRSASTRRHVVGQVRSGMWN